jgi:tripartite-type tricarboxylate transporter receptor subunit TctC
LQNALEPIAPISSNRLLILAKKTMPADDLKGLIAWPKSNPDKASMAIPKAGSNVAGILFQKETGTRFQFIRYRGGGPATGTASPHPREECIVPVCGIPLW